MRRVTFITHDASRSGAPMVLLTLMRWLRANTDLHLTTLAVTAGPLLDQFAALGPVRCLDEWQHFDRVRKLLGLIVSPEAKPTPWLVHQAAGGILRNAERAIARSLHGSDLIYANSVESALGVRAAHGNEPLIAHVHEGAYYLLAGAFHDEVRTVVQAADRVIASSTGVQEAVVDNLGVPRDSVTVCYPFIDARDYPPAAEKAVLRTQLGLPPDAFIVGMCGGMAWRKAPDIFLAVGRETLRQAPADNVVFVWVGGREHSAADRYAVREVDAPFSILTRDLEELGLTGRIRFIPHQADPRPYLRTFDVLFLSSRAEVFPLICLETALLAEAPVVCFDHASDITDLITDGCGSVVPYLDTSAAAAAILALCNDGEQRTRMGRRLADLVRRRHDVANSAPRIATVITELL